MTISMPCYASHLGDCSGPMSREHPVPEAILSLVGKGVGVRASGVSWNAQGKYLPPSALAARVLCKKHNEYLSPYDEELKWFSVALLAAIQSAHRGETPATTFAFSGATIQYSLLKVACSMIASRTITRVDGRRENELLPARWVDVLFQRVPWPDNWHMGVLQSGGAKLLVDALDPVFGLLHHEDGALSAVEYATSGVKFMLMIEPLKPLGDDRYLPRPKAVVFRHQNDHTVEHSVSLEWGQMPTGREIPMYLMSGIDYEEDTRKEDSDS